jgi:hypothetical protein
VDPFRFSQATLEDTQEDELNAILGELSALQLSLDREIKPQGSPSHSSEGHGGHNGQGTINNFQLQHPHANQNHKAMSTTSETGKKIDRIFARKKI